MPYQAASGYNDSGAGELGEFRNASGYSDAGAGELGSYLGEATPTYVQWVDAVKANGGTVVTWPFDDANAGKPAARFPVATYVELFNAGKISPSDTQQASGTNQYVYVLANDDVANAARLLTNVTDREAATLPGASWNPFANLSTSSKVITGAAAVTALAAVLGLFRGRR